MHTKHTVTVSDGWTHCGAVLVYALIQVLLCLSHVCAGIYIFLRCSFLCYMKYITCKRYNN